MKIHSSKYIIYCIFFDLRQTNQLAMLSFRDVVHVAFFKDRCAFQPSFDITAFPFRLRIVPAVSNPAVQLRHDSLVSWFIPYGTQGRRFLANVPLTNLTWANCSNITTLHPEKVAITSWATHSNGWQYMFLKFRYGQKPKTWGLSGRVQEVFGWLFCSKRGKRMKHAETKTASRI